jgi:PAS domain-containing protein
MLNRVVYGDDILAQAKSLTIKALYIKWKTLSQIKRLTLTDFLENDDKVSRRLVVLLIAGDDYACIYQGAEHRLALGRNLSGNLLSNFDNRVVRELRSIYDQVRETKMPIRLIYASDGAQFAVGWERLILPIVIADEVRMVLSYSEALNSAAEVHDYLFNDSPHMLIVALPITGFDDVIVDADIIQINPAAARFFGTEHLADFPIRLRELSPWFSDDHLWQMLTEKTEKSRECTLAGHDREQTFRCVLMKLDYLLVFRIHLIDVPEVVTV